MGLFSKAREILDRVTGSGGGDGDTPFQAAVFRICRQNGYKLASAGADHAVFDFTYRGKTYEVLLVDRGHQVRVAVGSNARFPRGNLPLPVRRFLADPDTQRGFSWKEFEGHRASWLVLCYDHACEEVDGQIFDLALKYMLPLVEQFDGTMAELGLR